MAKIFVTALIFVCLLACSEKTRIQKECGSPIMWFNPPKPARFGHYNYVYPLLKRYHARFGAYPELLDSLTKLDSIDYSYMTRAWKVKYLPSENGSTYSLDEFSEKGMDSLHQVRIDEFQKLKEHSKRWDECVARVKGK